MRPESCPPTQHSPSPSCLLEAASLELTYFIRLEEKDRVWGSLHSPDPSPLLCGLSPLILWQQVIPHLGFCCSALVIHLEKLPGCFFFFFFGLALSKPGFMIHRVFKHKAKGGARKTWVGVQTINPKPCGFTPGERIRAPGRRPEPVVTCL